jgi:ribonuclease HI
MYELHFDALFRSAQVNTCAGVMCTGWLIRQNERLIARGYGATARGTDATSNIAEYLALIDGLQALVDMAARRVPVTVIGDAKVVICQMKGTSRINSERMLPMHRKATRLANKLNIIAWEWVPRSKNKEADLLARRALRGFHSDPQQYQQVWSMILRDHQAGRAQLRSLSSMLVVRPQVI